VKRLNFARSLVSEVVEVEVVENVLEENVDRML
jgi:hypothetical protein